MNFYPHKAIEIQRQSNGLIGDKDLLCEFWEEVDSEIESGLSGGIGCYVFSVRAGKGALPWYVGLAEKQSFRKECFSNHKLVHYNNVLASRSGTPMLTLVAKYTPGDRLVSPTGNEHRDIQYLETLLIAKCVSRNEYLCNKQDTKFLREMTVCGLLNTPQGMSSGAVSDFRALIGV